MPLSVQVQPIDHILQEGELFIHFFLFIVHTGLEKFGSRLHFGFQRPKLLCKAGSYEFPIQSGSTPSGILEIR